MRGFLIALLLFAAPPAQADRYSGAPPEFQTELIAECLVRDFHEGWTGTRLPDDLRPDDDACRAALLPCHVRYGLPLEPDLDLAALPPAQEHQVRHCLFEHLELAEWLGYLNVERAADADAEPRVAVRDWVRRLRRSYERCGARFEDGDTNRVMCHLAGVIAEVADRRAGETFGARIEEWEKTR